MQELREEDFCLGRILLVMSITSGQISWKKKSHSGVHSFLPGTSQSGRGHKTFINEDSTLPSYFKPFQTKGDLLGSSQIPK